MVSILPTERSPWEAISNSIGHGLSQTLPQAAQQRSQRETGLSAIDQLQQQLQQSGGDINKMLPALAKAYTLNPGLERSGLGQTFMQQAKVGRAFPQQGQQGQQPQQDVTPQQNQKISSVGEQSKSNFPTPSPFNIMTIDQMNAESERWANAVNDPNGYNTRYNQLEAQNDSAIKQKASLEKSALNAGVDPGDLPRFMVVNQHLDPSNPNEWAQKAVRNFADVKNNDDLLRRTFIPGIGNGLLGQNRTEALNALRRPVQINAERGLEQEDRKYLAENYLTPTEIETLYHPLSPQKEKAVESLPRGLFPANKKETWGTLGTAKARQSPFVSYEEALEKDPQSLKIMQDKNTSLLGLRDKIWNEKDYDWRQFEPAIVQAINQKGIKLEPFQEREMASLTQPPMQSLPDIFKSMDRFIHYLRGSK